MDMEDTLQKLRELEPLELAGRLVLARTGQIPDFFALMETGAANVTVYADKGLSEALFMPEDVNVELEHLLRYVDIIPHRHDFFELVCVLEGTCRHTVAEQTAALAPGDITIVPPGLAHHLRAAPDCVCLTIKVRTSTFDQAFSALLQEPSLLSVYFTQNLYAPQSRAALTFHCGPDAFISEHLLYMYRQQQERRAYCGSIIEGLMSVLFSHLLQNHQESLEFSRGMTQFDRRMGEVIGYLGGHYATATLTGAARLFYMNPSYLSASLRKATGQTFSQLVRTFRLRRAAELLAHSRLKLEEIGEQIGYQDTTQFIRYFKAAYGVTPHVYRKQKH